MKLRKSELRGVINEQVQAFFVTPPPLGSVSRGGSFQSSLKGLEEKDINKDALKDIIKQIVVDVEESSNKRMQAGGVTEISGVDSLKPNDPKEPGAEEVEKIAAKDVMEAEPKAKKGKPRGAPHIENVRFWDLPEKSLRYIIKDASEAIAANPIARKAAGKWPDEVNDAVTVLHFRKKKGIKESFNTAPAGQGKRQASVIDTDEAKEVGSLASSPKSKALIKKMHALVTKKLKFKTVEDIQPIKDGVAFIFGDKAEASKMAAYLKKAGALGKVIPMARGGGKRTMVSLKYQSRLT